jgi:hypothetical protein
MNEKFRKKKKWWKIIHCPNHIHQGPSVCPRLLIPQLLETTDLPSAPGNHWFAKCQGHSTNASLHSVKGFAECHTWQRPLDKKSVDKGLYAKCHLSGTRQVSVWPSTKKSRRDGVGGRNGRFAVCHRPGTRQICSLCRVLRTRHLANLLTLPSATDPALGKLAHFAECHGLGTRQTCSLCRVPSAWHSVN